MSIPARILGACLGAIVVMSLAGCAPSSYVVNAPTPSAQAFNLAAPPQAVQLSVLDERRGSDQTFHDGVLKSTLMSENAAIDAPGFLAKHVAAELSSRGIPTSAATADAGLPRIHLRTFRIQNYRASGFSPFVTFTYLSADVETPSGNKRIAAWVKRGKVPVWSFDEVIEPIFNQPLSIAVKEFSAKLANSLYGSRASDETVRQLSEKLAGPRSPEIFLDVYALGFTNNPSAIDKLVELTRDPDEYVRLAAISSLGTVGASAQLPMLESLYNAKDGMWQDRAMAIKAIGDLGTPEALAFLRAELARIGSQASDKDAQWTTQVIALYL